MKPERWKKIDELVQAALDRGEDERAAFISEACEGDDLLRREVESVLAYHDQAHDFLESPAIEQAAELIADQAELRAGQSLGRYRIIESLGRGGMGEVYLARDTLLDRKVALKLLPAPFTDDKDRLRRFMLEAKAASALNHPNIITIHEIGQSEGAHFIAIEFIEGHTLRAHLSRARMTVTDALEVAIQVADALAAAHSAGIIHRDIKPENIMLRPDGYVKVLDFGLAKLTEKSQSPSIDSQMETISRNFTEPGALLGTVNYMSPEQARGLDIDARTDIFSLGAVIYEMAAGRMPFTGETSADVIVSILSREPPPLSECAPEVSSEFQRIVSRAISKNREERYQTIKDLLLDLKSLKEELAFEEKLERSNPQKNRAHEQAIDSMEETIINQTKPAAASPAQQTTRGSKRALALALMVVALAAASITLVAMWPDAKPATAIVAPDPQFVSYWILAQKHRDGKPYGDAFRLRDDAFVEKDYQIRFNVRSSHSGYLYLLNEGPATTDTVPTFVVMFPSETANKGSAQIAEGQQIRIPERTWFRFYPQQGREKIWMVWANSPVSELEAVRRFANPKDRGFIKSRELRASVYEFLKSHSSSRPSVERGDEETVVRAGGDIIMHVINLEHH